MRLEMANTFQPCRTKWSTMLRPATPVAPATKAKGLGGCWLNLQSFRYCVANLGCPVRVVCNQYGGVIRGALGL